MTKATGRPETDVLVGRRSLSRPVVPLTQCRAVDVTSRTRTHGLSNDLMEVIAAYTPGRKILAARVSRLADQGCSAGTGSRCGSQLWCGSQG